jgi:hypothetical protein
MPPRPFDYSTEGLQTSPNKQKCPAPVNPSAGPCEAAVPRGGEALHCQAPVKEELYRMTRTLVNSDYFVQETTKIKSFRYTKNEYVKDQVS